MPAPARIAKPAVDQWSRPDAELIFGVRPKSVSQDRKSTRLNPGHGDPRDLPSLPTRRSSDLDACSCQDCEAGGGPVVAPGCGVDLRRPAEVGQPRSEEHTSELQSRLHLVC